jgi:hypothetical protein
MHAQNVIFTKDYPAILVSDVAVPCVGKRKMFIDPGF